MRFLLLGYGSIGKRHAKILRGMGHRVTTVDPDLASGAANGAISNTDCWDFDGVLDCTPPNARPVLELPFRYAFIEKPLGIVPQPGWPREPIQMGFCYRFVPSLIEFVGIIKRAGVASLYIHGGQNLQDWHKEDYRTVKERYHGVVTDSLPHSIFIARWILGDLEYRGSTAAKSGALELDVEDTVGVALAGPNGEPCLLEANYLQRPRNFQIDAKCWDFTWRQWQFAPLKEVGPMYQRQMEAFVKLCAGEEIDVPTLADGIAVQEILDAIERP